MTTTAQYRQAAQQAEADLQWNLAVFFWNRALEVYPNVLGEFAEADKDKIRTAINADMTMVRESHRLRRFQASGSDAPAPVPMYERP
jgi:predicted lipid-binding transport protein (Tim44 family)